MPGAYAVVTGGPELVYYAGSPSTTPVNGLLNACGPFSRPLTGVVNAEVA
ncbi:hypothetical protein [Actinomyces ruminis]|nr:hypothetical protein [Actinomyces ruminis]